MSARVKTALIALPVVLAVLFFGGRILFGLVIAAVAVLGAREYAGIAGGGGNALDDVFVPLWAGVLVLGFLAPSTELPGELLALGSLVYLAVWIMGKGPGEDTLRRWASTLGAWVFVGLFLGHLVWVRSHGVGPVLFLSVLIWTGDTAAYYVGSAFGRRKLAPAVSPGKTVEGAAASVVASALMAFFLARVLELPHAPAASLFFGVAINVAAQLGDLAESLLKRCGGVKDSGALFPGHGGMLDRVDAFLLAGPVYALFLRL
ncbi:MAG: phosphatidate cytidylyltransferase [Deltaproteobacteria bacterium]|nr:phosphatidate cytidylyltransferase [Deltaproteobacteria bacterium]